MDLQTIFQGPITPEKWRMLGRYLNGQTAQPTTGMGQIMEKSGTSGVSISPKKQRQVKPTQSPPFSVLSCRKVPDSDPVEYALTLQEGWVVQRNTQTGVDGVTEFEPTIDGTTMSTRPRPELTVESGQFVACEYNTDDEGYIYDTPTITAGDEQDSDHHQPPSGAGSGATGFYWIKLFKFEITDGAPVFTYYQQSDIEHSRLWTGRNIGGARYIHKEFDGSADRYDFRTLEQVEPVGRTFGKVIVDEVNGDEFDDANDSIKFSAICERDTNPQINVNDDGAGAVTVEGNDRDGSLTWTDCDTVSPTVTTLLEWEDGLVTTNGISNFTAGCGVSLPPYPTTEPASGNNWVLCTTTGGSLYWYEQAP